MKICIACGMPMNAQDDFAMGDEKKDYCRFCAKPDGAMLTYEEKLANVTKLIQNKQGLDEVAAKEIAKKTMLTFPAWR